MARHVARAVFQARRVGHDGHRHRHCRLGLGDGRGHGQEWLVRAALDLHVAHHLRGQRPAGGVAAAGGGCAALGDLAHRRLREPAFCDFQPDVARLLHRPAAQQAPDAGIFQRRRHICRLHEAISRDQAATGSDRVLFRSRIHQLDDVADTVHCRHVAGQCHPVDVGSGVCRRSGPARHSAVHDQRPVHAAGHRGRRNRRHRRVRPAAQDEYSGRRGGRRGRGPDV